MEPRGAAREPASALITVAVKVTFWPKVNGSVVETMTVPVSAGWTVRMLLAGTVLLTVCWSSCGKWALIVCGFVATCGAVRVMVQLLVLLVGVFSVHVGALKESPPTFEERVTVPCGVSLAPWASTSVTVAVTVSCVAIFTGLTEKLTTVEVWRVATVRAAALALALCTCVAWKATVMLCVPVPLPLGVTVTVQVAVPTTVWTRVQGVV